MYELTPALAAPVAASAVPKKALTTLPGWHLDLVWINVSCVIQCTIQVVPERESEGTELEY
jgi:hypothetical protein